MGLRLDHLNLLGELDKPVPGDAGKPMLLPLDAIDEDPEQPRREFDADALQELAATIRERGVRQPVSVRPHPTQPDRWMLNFGARRLRASRIAGLSEIPAFVDPSADSYDQVIENEQREGLKPLELALFVQKRLAQGETQAEIARRMGKSRVYVTYATALIKAPDWLLNLYRQGRCRGMHALHDLRRLHEQHPQAVEAWTGDRAVITREDVDALRAELSGRGAGPRQADVPEPVQMTEEPDRSSVGCAGSSQAATPTPATSPAEPAQATRPGERFLVVEKDGQDYELLFFAMPADAGNVYVRSLQGGPRIELRADTLTLLGSRCR